MQTRKKITITKAQTTKPRDSPKELKVEKSVGSKTKKRTRFTSEDKDCIIGKRIELEELWEISTRFLWDEAYIKGLDKFLRELDIKTILDVAGGAGFPSIELRRMEWDITYSDGSKSMIDLFKKRLEATSLEIPVFHSDWLDLSKNIPGKFDAVLCRGNSLIYIDSWEESDVREDTKERIRNALEEFYKMLNPGGLLYVDMITKNEYGHSIYPIIEDLGEKEINGKKMKMEWQVVHDPENKRRTVKSLLSGDHIQDFHTYHSYLLTHPELVDMLKQAGFRRIEETKIDGEGCYTVFVAKK
jgi:SAM-dependent methyltransferase